MPRFVSSLAVVVTTPRCTTTPLAGGAEGGWESLAGFPIFEHNRLQLDRSEIPITIPERRRLAPLTPGRRER